jgi:WD40 repeat protein
VALAALLSVVATLGSAQGQKLAELPSPTEIKAAVETLRDVYDKDYAAAEKDAKGKKALAQRLFDGAAKRTTPAVIFASYEEARLLAAAAGDVKLALSAANAQLQRFPNLSPTLVADTVKLLGKGIDSGAETVSFTALAREESSLALEREDYDSACELLALAVAAVRKAEDIDHLFELRAELARLDTLKKAFATVKTKPDDSEANNALATYWLFTRQRWDIGLKYLARGADKALADVARVDLAVPKTAKDRTNLADLWYGFARGAMSDRKQLFLLRAWDWYSNALIVATGDEGLKAMERAKEIEKTDPSLFVQVLTGHTAAVAAVAVTPDGKTLVSAGNDNSVRVWDAATAKLLKSLEGHTSWVGSVVTTPDNNRAITAGGDGLVRVWDIKAGRQVEGLDAHRLVIRGLAISADGKSLVSGGNDKACRLWDLTLNKELRKFGSGKEVIESVAISPDGSRVFAGSETGVVTVYDAKTGSTVSTFDKHGPSTVFTVTVSRDGRTAFSGARDKEIQIWDVASGKLVRSLTGHTEQVYQLVLSRDEKQLLSASYDKTLRIWDLETGKELKRFEGHTDGVQGACYSPNGQFIYSASWDKTIRKWRLPTMLSGTVQVSTAKKLD